MKRFLFILAIAALALSACTPPATESPAVSTPQTVDYIPNPADATLTRGEVHLDSAELLIMESYPLQFALGLTGNLPTPCHKVRVAVSQPDKDNKIDVNVYSVADPNEICAQVLEPFDINIPLGSFPTGQYTLWINGKMIAEFTS